MRGTTFTVCLYVLEIITRGSKQTTYIPIPYRIIKKTHLPLVTNFRIGYYMTKQRNRVNLTLDDELYQTLTELSELTGTPRATIIHELLNDVKPHIEKTLELAKLLKQEKIQMTDVQQFFYGMVADANEDIARAVRMLNEDKRDDTDDGSGG